MKCFYLWRTEDESGISGTGRVAQGFIADNGKVALFWLSEHPSVTIYDNIGEVKAIHGHSGKTEVRMEPDYKRAFHQTRLVRVGRLQCASSSPGLLPLRPLFQPLPSELLPG